MLVEHMCNLPDLNEASVVRVEGFDDIENVTFTDCFAKDALADLEEALV